MYGRESIENKIKSSSFIKSIPLLLYSKDWVLNSIYQNLLTWASIPTSIIDMTVTENETFKNILPLNVCEVWLHVYTHTHAQATYVCVREWRSERHIKFIFISFFSLFLSLPFTLRLELAIFWLGWKPGIHRLSFVLHYHNQLWI